MPDPTVVTSFLPVASPVVCLIGLLGVVALRKWPNLREGATLVAATVNLCLVIAMASRILGHDEVLRATIAEAAPGLTIAFRVDALSMIFALVAGTLWLVNSVYAIGYMRGLEEHAQTRFFASFTVAIASAMGVAFSANLFTLFICYEILTLSTYPLVFHMETKEAIGGAKRYLAILLGTSVGFQLPALIMIWFATGHNIEFGLHPLLDHRVAGASDTFLVVAFILFIAGIGKGALMPLHGWLPAAMVAPTPVSAFLHAVAVVKAGVFCIATVVIRVYGPELCRHLSLDLGLTIAACFTIVTASIVALRQDNLKRRLAYSTVSQLSYIILGVALCTRLGMTGGLFHIGAHAVSKITLFFCAGAIYVAHHKKYVSELDGIGRKMPITMTAFAIGSISMIGVPPTSGVISKIYLAIGSMEPMFWFVLAVLFVSTLLNACYFLPIVTRAFLRPLPAGEDATRQEAPWPMVVALSLTAAATVFLFFVPDLFLSLAEHVVGTAP